MNQPVTREDVLKAIEHVQHPEIAVTLMDLGMILDVGVEGNTANVALALPMLNIPEAVVQALIESIRPPVEKLGLKIQIKFFEMLPDVREKFFALSQANWKGSI